MKKNTLQDLTKLANKRAQKEYEWVKYSIFMVSIVFGLIISLYNPAKDSNAIYFAITIVINSLCILCGLIFLYGETHTIHRLIQEYIRKNESGELSNGSYSIVVDRNKFFSFLKIAYFVLIFLSFSSIAFYAINK